MKIRARKRGSICILEFSGEMRQPEGTRRLDDEFRRALDNGERLFIFDMLGVPWLDTSCIAQVIACHKRLRDRNGAVKLVLDGGSRELFTLYQLHRVFRLFDNLEDALASFAAEPERALSDPS